MPIYFSKYTVLLYKLNKYIFKIKRYSNIITVIFALIFKEDHSTKLQISAIVEYKSQS